MDNAFENETVGAIVAADLRTASVFQDFGIDYCCGGQQSITEACRVVGITPDTLKRALEALPAVDERDEVNVTGWSPDQLIDHILNTHHAYVRSALPAIGAYLAKLVQVHGERHPELLRVRTIFEEMSRGLLEHMMKEETILFPYIRELAEHPTVARSLEIVEGPIRVMEHEHRQAGDELRIIRELTSDWTPPPDGCATYRVCFEALAAFDEDLHRHIHLENNVLFPKALEISAAHETADNGS